MLATYLQLADNMITTTAIISTILQLITVYYYYLFPQIILRTRLRTPLDAFSSLWGQVYIESSHRLGGLSSLDDQAKVITSQPSPKRPYTPDQASIKVSQALGALSTLAEIAQEILKCEHGGFRPHMRPHLYCELAR